MGGRGRRGRGARGLLVRQLLRLPLRPGHLDIRLMIYDSRLDIRLKTNLGDRDIRLWVGAVGGDFLCDSSYAFHCARVIFVYHLVIYDSILGDI